MRYSSLRISRFVQIGPFGLRFSDLLKSKILVLRVSHWSVSHHDVITMPNFIKIRVLFKSVLI